MKLPIEDNPPELLEYSRAHAYINQVDYLLGSFIDFQKRRQKQFRKTCTGQTLGQKIENNKKYIPSMLLTDLQALNEKRKELSHHGFILFMDPQSNSMRPATIKELPDMIKVDNVDIQDLQEIVGLGGKLMASLTEEFKK